MKKANITRITETYIAEHPSIKDCVKKELVNYSKLTRLIAKDAGIDLRRNFDAVLIACRRYFQKVRQQPTEEARIQTVLKQSKVGVKNKIIVAIVEKGVYVDHLLELEKEIKKKAEGFHVIEGTSAITLITGEEFLPRMKALFKNKIVKIRTDLVEITLKSPKEIEQVSGIIGYLYSLFAENSINIIETMSCWTDTLFVIEEKDIAKAMALLKF